MSRHVLSLLLALVGCIGTMAAAPTVCGANKNQLCFKSAWTPGVTTYLKENQANATVQCKAVWLPAVRSVLQLAAPNLLDPNGTAACAVDSQVRYVQACFALKTTLPGGRLTRSIVQDLTADVVAVPNNATSGLQGALFAWVEGAHTASGQRYRNAPCYINANGTLPLTGRMVNITVNSPCTSDLPDVVSTLACPTLQQQGSRRRRSLREKRHRRRLMGHRLN